jgi:hypothetical protein
LVYDTSLAERLRQSLIKSPGLSEKKMFGGVAFLLNGNMVCGVYHKNLVLRVGKDSYETAIKKKHTRPFDISGRPMRGWVMVEPAGYEGKKVLEAWIALAMEHVQRLPPK